MTNHLHGQSGIWMGDGSEGTIHEERINAGDTTVTLTSAKRGSPLNGYFKIRPGNDHATTQAAGCLQDYYFECTIQELNGNVSVGVVTEKQVRPGWKTRGMFYNGNLTNGSAALKTSFGEHIKAGTKVGVLCETTTTDSVTHTRLYFYVNDQCLGLAFDIVNNSNDSNGHRFHYLPCLHVSGIAKVTWIVPEQIPSQRTRYDPSGAPTNGDPYKGDWKLIQAFCGPELGEFTLPSHHDVIAKMQPDDQSTYSLSVRVANTLRTQVSVVDKNAEGWDIVRVGPAMASTMMMPPPELQRVESELLGQGLSGVTKMRVDSDSSSTRRLLLQGPTAEFHFAPYIPTFAPLTKY